MRFHPSLFPLLLLLLLQLPTRQNTTAQARAAFSLARMPLSFTTQQNSDDDKLKFTARGSGYALALAENEITLALREDARLTMKLLNANPQPQMEGVELLPGHSNYFLGNDPREWRTDLPTFARVRYREIYPGVDLLFYGNQQELEYDFLLAPGARAEAIKLEFAGADKIEIDESGALALHVNGALLRMRKPVAYQQKDGQRREIASNYVLTSDKQIAFQLGAYDHNQPLIIDPLLIYSTYLGGSGIDVGHAIAVDSRGAVYVTGQTFSPNFPLRTPVSNTLGGANDAFVLKLNPAGTMIVYSTFIGGRSANDRGLALAVDKDGNAYFAGETNSFNFPTVNPVQPMARGNGDAFAAKLSIDGNVLLYSTFLGGSLPDEAYGLALDRFGDAYITGRTASANFLTRNAAQPALRGFSDAFVTRLNADGGLVYSTFLGGEAGGRDDEAGYAVAVDALSNAYITGFTLSPNFPTVNALQRTLGGGEDGFITKLDPSGSQFLFSTFLGGAQNEAGRGIAVDATGNVYVTGYTLSPNFPTVNALQAALGGAADAFVTKLNAAGTELLYSTFLGGGGDENTGLAADATPVGAIAVDRLGNAYVTGKTASDNFPLALAMQPLRRGDNDAFLAKINPAGTAMSYSTYFGSSFTGSNGADERGLGIAVDAGGDAYITGQVLGTDLFTTSPLQGRYGGGVSDAFITKISAPDIVTLATVSAASFAGTSLAPEAMIAAFGAGLAPGVEVARTIPLPATLQGTTVKITDKLGVERAAPLFFVSPNQVNFLVPPGTATGAATIALANGQNAPIKAVVQIESVAPALFSANASGQGVAAAVALRVKADGAQSFEPVARYDELSGRFFALPLDLSNNQEQVFLLLFGSGIRQRSALAAVTINVGGVQTPALFAGPQGGFVGFDQINLQLPRSLAGRGEVTVSVTVDGRIANLVEVNIR